MTIRILISFLFFAVIQNTFSQTDSPVGKWKLTQHLFDVEQGDSVLKDVDVLNADFSATIDFKEDGTFIHTVNGVDQKGKWKLTKKNTKFALKFADGSSFSMQNRKFDPINFEDPLELSEHFSMLYPPSSEFYPLGTSVYIREDNAMDFNDKMVGKWSYCVKTEPKPTNDCIADSTDFYDLKPDGTFTAGHEYTYKGKKYVAHGTWKMIDANALVIHFVDEDGINRSGFQINMTWLNETTFYSVGIEGIKRGPTVHTYYRKI